MKETVIETLGALALVLLVCFAFSMMFVGDDISRNSMGVEARQNAEKAKAERSAKAIGQWRAEEEIDSLGCATLDCAIGKLMKQ